jgi:hypothetical protein
MGKLSKHKQHIKFWNTSKNLYWKAFSLISYQNCVGKVYEKIQII